MNRRDFLSSLLLLGPTVASGYLLPRRHLLRKVSSRLQRSPKLSLELEGRLWTAEGSLEIRERWRFDQPGKRLECLTQAGPRQLRWDQKGDDALRPHRLLRQSLQRLFVEADLGALMRDLKIDHRRESLSLAGERVAHLLGAGPREPQRPQVWIDQESFLPLRVRAQEPDGLVDLQLLSWQGPISQGRFPHKIRLNSQRRLRRELELLSISQA